MARERSKLLMVRLPESHKAKLDEAAEERELPSSTLVRLIVSEWLRAHRYLPKKKQSKKGGE